MNLTYADPTAPPPQPPQPPRSSFSCDRHPSEQFTGFCPSCLCERLTTLDQSTSNTPSSSRRPSSASAAAAAAVKSLFSSSSSKPNNNLLPPPPPLPKAPRPASFFPELRRTKSFSASKNEALGQFIEPQRKSCDVRVRNTLSSLLTLDNENKSGASANKPSSIAAAASSWSHQNHQNSKKVESALVNKPVVEEKEKDEVFRDPENVEPGDVVYDDCNDSNGDEIRSFRDSHVEYSSNLVEGEVNSGEIVEEEAAPVASLKPMKDHVDIDAREKKSAGGGLWAAASVFGKKWHDWRRKQKMKKQNNGDNFARLPVQKPISRQYRETQSEIADYGFGRRSCDTDPRFSLDVGRISFDDPRYSFDEPRASWDGYLIGRSFPRMAPMVSVMEDAPAVHVPRSDMQIPVEEPAMNSINEGDGVPGGSAQTREYYTDSSSRRRKSLDRSSSAKKTAANVVAEIDEVKAVSNARKSLDRSGSTRKNAAAVVAETDEPKGVSNARKSFDRSGSSRQSAAAVVAENDELKAVSNAKVSPKAADFFHGSKVMVGEREMRDSNSHLLRDDCSETFELGCGFRDSSNSVVGNAERKESKKSRRWSWRLWGFIQRRNGGNKDDDEEKYGGMNGVERSYSESWQDSRGEGNGDPRGGFNRHMFRSNSSVSWRNANHIGGPFESMRKSGVEMNGHWKKRKDEFVLEKNRSARYSPNHVDNGLLKLNPTPLRGSRKGELGKTKPNSSHSIARSVLRLY